MADLFDIVVARKLSGGGGGGGSSDFSTAEVTIIINEATLQLGFAWPVSIILSDKLLEAGTHQQQELSETHNVVLYKGSVETYFMDASNATASGNITIDGDILTVTGNGTITISY